MKNKNRNMYTMRYTTTTSPPNEIIISIVATTHIQYFVNKFETASAIRRMYGLGDVVDGTILKCLFIAEKGKDTLTKKFPGKKNSLIILLCIFILSFSYTNYLKQITNFSKIYIVHIIVKLKMLPNVICNAY